MSYVEGFVIPVPTANREAFIACASALDALFIAHGATRAFECWGEDVPHGALTDFHRAVRATKDETVVFSWIEWPDKATRDANVATIEAAMSDDPHLYWAVNPPPFDGKRLIYGGFTPVVVLGG